MMVAFAWATLTNLSGGQRKTRASLAKSNLKNARAYQIRLALQDLYDQPSLEAAAGHLRKCYFRATHSRLKSIIEAAHTAKRHWTAFCDGSTAILPTA